MVYIQRFAAAARSLSVWLSCWNRALSPASFPAQRTVTASELHRACTSTSTPQKGASTLGFAALGRQEVDPTSALYKDCCGPNQATGPWQRWFTTSSATLHPTGSVLTLLDWDHPCYGKPMKQVAASELQHACTPTRQWPDLTSMLYKNCCGPIQAMSLWRRGFTSFSTTLSPASVLPPLGWDHPCYGKLPMTRVPASALQRVCTSTSPLQKGAEPTGLASRVRRQQLDLTSVLYKNCCKCPNRAMSLWKRCFSASSKKSPHILIPAPLGWDRHSFDRPHMKRAVPPGYLEPDFAKTLKTVPGIVPQVCVDESAFLINYEPLEYIKTFPLVRKKMILGSKADTAVTDVFWQCPSILLPADSALELMKSLLTLARFFHVNGCCLPRIEMNNLVITGAGRFRLKEFSGFRELNKDNFQDVYANISELFMNLLSSYGDASELPGDFFMLKDQLQSHSLNHWRVAEYPLYFNSFFLPLGNKSTALLRIIDIILQMPNHSNIRNQALNLLPYQDFTPDHLTEWLHIAENNDYLCQWLNHRTYGLGRIEFLRFLRAVLSHKLDYGLPHRFVDFLVYALYPKVLSTLHRNMWTMGLLKQVQMEDLFPQSILIDFPDLPGK